MSYILIDAGNSCLKLSVMDRTTNLEVYSNVLDYNNLYDKFVDQLSEFMISNVIISNVNNPMITQILSDAIYYLWKIQPHIVTTEQNKFGISTLYSNPGLLGSDRWLALIAAKSEFQKDICVIDCGTAVTIDVLLNKGLHVGGFITPGLNMSRNALGLNANNLPVISDNGYKTTHSPLTFATNTHDAISAGTLYQLSAYLEYMITEIKNEISKNIECIITGGDAIIVQKLISHHLVYREKLVLDGLDVVAKDLFIKESL